MAQIRDVLPHPPVYYAVKPDDTVQKAAQLMGDHNVGIVMIIDGDKMLGVFSERDLTRRVLAEGKDPRHVKVNEVMTTQVVLAREDDDPEDCLRKMEHEGCRHMPVFSGDKPIAMLSIRDVMRYLLTHKEYHLKMLQDYVSS